MYAIDFEYDGKYLSDYGFIICNFNSASGADVADAGSKITFNKVSCNRGKQYSLASAQYDECIQVTFDICKNPDVYNYKDMVISNDEYRKIMRWLNRREFLKFQVLNRDDTAIDACYYDASFNIDKIKIGEILYGLRLTMETNRPFGYGKERIAYFNFDDITKSYTLCDMSDEIGYIYPHITLTCYEDGDIQLYNTLEDCTTIIKKCKAGEIITLDGDTQIITSSYRGLEICDNFNYEFFRIGNKTNDRNNRITVTKPCSIIIKYSPIIKEAP